MDEVKDDDETVPVDEVDGGGVSPEEEAEAGAGEDGGSKDEAVDPVTKQQVVLFHLTPVVTSTGLYCCPSKYSSHLVIKPSYGTDNMFFFFFRILLSKALEGLCQGLFCPNNTNNTPLTSYTRLSYLFNLTPECTLTYNTVLSSSDTTLSAYILLNTLLLHLYQTVLLYLTLVYILTDCTLTF